MSRLNAPETLPLLVACSTADGSFDACSYAIALIHLDPASATAVLSRYQRQFPKESQIPKLQGQAYWQLQDLDAAFVNFHLAVETKNTIGNLLALVHFYLEQDDLPTATEYMRQATQKETNIYERIALRGSMDEQAICLLTQAVVQWISGESKAGLATLKLAFQKDRHIMNIKDLQYAYFWREKAITALEEMLA